MSTFRAAAFSLLALCVAPLTPPQKTAQAQSSRGDQFLDDIGKTALVARYVLAGNAEDWSRNNHHDRIYAMALTDAAVAALHRNARSSDAAADSNTPATPELTRSRTGAVTSPMANGATIVATADVRVETVVGHIPQITGALAIYRSNQDPRYYRVADNFWRICRRSYMYAIGGVAGARTPDNAECFTAEPDSLFRNGFSPGGQNETCATYNSLKLSRQLFLYAPETDYMDCYEQALYNHILASVAEGDPGNTYHVPLNPGARKRFGNSQMRGFTCCNGTALESSTKLQDSIYFRNADNSKLYVNLFVPSTLHWESRSVVVTQATSFPYSDRTKLTIDGAGEFAVLIRSPKWAVNGIRVSINGQRLLVETAPGEPIILDRTWKSGDTIDLRMPMSFRLGRIMDQPNIAGIFYGPVLLAVEESGALSDWRRVKIKTDDIRRSIKGDPRKLRFQIGDLQLKPFFEAYDRYSVYLDVVPE